MPRAASPPNPAAGKRLSGEIAALPDSLGVRYFAMLLGIALVLAAADVSLLLLLNGLGRPIHVLSLVLIIASLSILGVGWFLVLRPIVQRVRADYLALHDLHERYRTLVEGALDAVVISDPDGRILEWNPQAESILGWTREEAVGRTIDALLIPARYRGKYAAKMGLFRNSRDPAVLTRHVEMTVLHREGREVPIEIALSAIPHGGTFLLCAFARDITARRAAMESLRREKETAQRYLDVAGVFMAVLGPDLRIRTVNQKGCAILGHPEVQIVGRGVLEFVPGRLRGAIEKGLHSILSGESPMPEYFEMPILTQAGEERLVAWRNTAVRDETGGIASVLSSGEDITERRKIERQFRKMCGRLQKTNRRLEQLALEDPLTGLMNRRGLQRMLSREIRWATREGASLLAILVDLDDFKRVNDAYSHAVGDAVLAEAARRLRDCLRATDYAARIGGDEFMVLLPKTSPKEGVAVTERIRNALAAFPVRHGGAEVSFTASLGVAEVTDKLPTVDELLTLTHDTLRESKEGGKNKASYHWMPHGRSARDPAVADAVEALQRGDRFRVVTHPIMSLADETPVGVELLARSTVGEFEMPDDFFRICSQLRVLSAVDRQCLMKCIEASGALPAGMRRHVNLFPATLAGTPVETLLSAFPDPAERPAGGYCVEIGSRRLVENTFRLGEAMRALKKNGILVAVDDVSFGARGLRSLVVFAPDLAKIDRECVSGVCRDPRKEKALRHLVRVAQDLGAQVVIEGIEDRDDLAVVKALGVQYGQGYLWGKPADCASR